MQRQVKSASYHAMAAWPAGRGWLLPLPLARCQPLLPCLLPESSVTSVTRRGGCYQGSRAHARRRADICEEGYSQPRGEMAEVTESSRYRGEQMMETVLLLRDAGGTAQPRFAVGWGWTAPSPKVQPMSEVQENSGEETKSALRVAGVTPPVRKSAPNPC